MGIVDCVFLSVEFVLENLVKFGVFIVVGFGLVVCLVEKQCCCVVDEVDKLLQFYCDEEL